MQYPDLLQVTKTSREDIRTSAAETVSEIAEALRSQHEFAYDQKRPAFTDEVQRMRDRTALGVAALLGHAVMIASRPVLEISDSERQSLLVALGRSRASASGNACPADYLGEVGSGLVRVQEPLLEVVGVVECLGITVGDRRVLARCP